MNKYRLRYYWKKLGTFFGFCPCGSRVNFTRDGRALCPNCKRR